MGEIILNGRSYNTGPKCKEVTQAEYNALPASKLTDGILYCVTDAPGPGEGFPPMIYSYEEREVGVWVDGKPLYQKTISFGALPNSSGKNVPHGISNLEYIVYALASASDSTYSSQRPIPYVHFNNASSQVMLNYSQTNIHIQCSGNLSEYTKTFVTLFYTKTTDTPGSGKWTTQGTPTYHYSTTEHIVGTWIDGKPLYEKTIHTGEIRTTLINVAHNISNIDNIIKIFGYAKIDSGIFVPLPFVQFGASVADYQIRVHADTTNISFSTTNLNDGADSYIILQYTKTTD